jgi:hypothetical protein
LTKGSTNPSSGAWWRPSQASVFPHSEVATTLIRERAPKRSFFLQVG